LARYYENSERLLEAEHFYHQANTLSDESKNTQLDLVGFYIRHNFLDEAVPVMTTIQEQGPAVGEAAPAEAAAPVTPPVKPRCSRCRSTS